MTNRILPAAVSVFAVAGLAVALLAPTRAEAQCRPDDIFCAELRIGPAQPPPPPPVVVQPPPPPVVVQPPPPVYVPPPQPPVVIVQPAQPQPPPQVVVVRPPPRQPPPPATVTVQVERRRTVRYELVPDFEMGLHINLAGMNADQIHMGGVQAGFRIRPVRHLAIELGAGVFGGESLHYNGGGGRWEVPINVNLMLFFNPQHRFQVYALLGAGVSVAGQEIGGGRMRELEYVGGQAGLGFEWRLGRHFALNLDGRGFLRTHVGDDGPEFSRVTSSGDIETTNLSGGFYGTVGMTFYFGGR